QGMFAVANEPGGTAYAYRITEPGFEMCGKTGTAQVRVITAEERAAGVIDNDKLPWKLRDHALFVAFAPANAPRYGIAIVVEHGGHGGSAAAPIARDTLKFAMDRKTLDRPPVEIARVAAVASEEQDGGATQ